jgi:hypothetical protein
MRIRGVIFGSRSSGDPVRQITEIAPFRRSITSPVQKLQTQGSFQISMEDKLEFDRLVPCNPFRNLDIMGNFHVSRIPETAKNRSIKSAGRVNHIKKRL